MERKIIILYTGICSFSFPMWDLTHLNSTWVKELILRSSLSHRWFCGLECLLIGLGVRLPYFSISITVLKTLAGLTLPTSNNKEEIKTSECFCDLHFYIMICISCTLFMIFVMYIVCV